MWRVWNYLFNRHYVEITVFDYDEITIHANGKPVVGRKFTYETYVVFVELYENPDTTEQRLLGMYGAGEVISITKDGIIIGDNILPDWKALTWKQEKYPDPKLT